MTKYTYRQQFNRKYGFPLNTSHSRKEVSKLSGAPMRILDEVAKRGSGAWRTNLPSVRLRKDYSKNPNIKKYGRSKRLSREQWSMARIYSFVMGGKTSKTADRDLYLDWKKRSKRRKSKRKSRSKRRKSKRKSRSKRRKSKRK